MIVFKNQIDNKTHLPPLFKFNILMNIQIIVICILTCFACDHSEEQNSGESVAIQGGSTQAGTQAGMEQAGMEQAGMEQAGMEQGGSNQAGTEMLTAGIEAGTQAGTQIHTPTTTNHWCDAALGEGAGERDFILDFAAAHATLHLFGTQSAWMQADQILTTVLREESPFQMNLLEQYQLAFDETCVLYANSVPTQEAVDQQQDTQIEIIDDTAWITPGFNHNELEPLPTEVKKVVIDLQNIEHTSDLSNVIAMALKDDVSIGTRRVRQFFGLPSHDDGWTHYETSLVDQDLIIKGNADQNRALFFITPARLTPTVSTWVAGLRLAGYAWIIGHTVFSQVAESTWMGIDSQGLMIHTSTLYQNNTPWPDVLPADIVSLTPADFMGILPTQLTSDNTEIIDSTYIRPEIQRYDRDTWNWETADTSLHKGVMRAGLIIAWGVLDRFYPFFDLVGRELDQQLIRSLDEVADIADNDRSEYMKTLGRFMHDLYDGHGFYSDWAGDWPSGYLIIQIQRVDGKPVIRSSMHEGIEAGDTIVEIDGMAADLWYEEAMSRFSASTEGYRFVLASNELKEVWGSKTLVVRSADGVERSLTIQGGRPWEDQDLVPWGGTRRPNSWLTDLEADDIYYLNLAGDVTIDDDIVYEEVVASVVALGDDDKLILDMRDYPAINYYELERYFHTEVYTTPQFWFPVWTGSTTFELIEDSWSFTPLRPAWTGSTALLMSNKSVSSAENVGQMLEYLPNVKVVGQTSAGTNGTVTSFWLPSNISITFTGMRLRNPDGSEFHGIGLVPDVDVIPTPQEFASGIDPELMMAIDILHE